MRLFSNCNIATILAPNTEYIYHFITLLQFIRLRFLSLLFATLFRMNLLGAAHTPKIFTP